MQKERWIQNFRGRDVQVAFVTGFIFLILGYFLGLFSEEGRCLFRIENCSPDEVIVHGHAGSSQFGEDETGVTYPCRKTGLYRIDVVSGSYSPFQDGAKQWRTAIFIFLDTPIDEIWGLNRSASMGRDIPQPILDTRRNWIVGSFEEEELNDSIRAENLGIQQSITIPCAQGQTMLLMPYDEKGRYFDNQGFVTLGIYPPR